MKYQIFDGTIQALHETAGNQLKPKSLAIKFVGLTVLIAFSLTSTLAYGDVWSGADRALGRTSPRGWRGDAPLAIQSLTKNTTLNAILDANHFLPSTAQVAAQGTVKVQRSELRANQTPAESGLARSELRADLQSLIKHAEQKNWLVQFDSQFENEFYKLFVDAGGINEKGVLDLLRHHSNVPSLVGLTSMVFSRGQFKTLPPAIVAELVIRGHASDEYYKQYYSPEVLEAIRKAVVESPKSSRGDRGDFYHNALDIIRNWKLTDEDAVNLAIFLYETAGKSQMSLNVGTWRYLFSVLGEHGAAFREKVEPILTNGLSFGNSDGIAAVALAALVSFGWYPKLSEDTLPAPLSDLFSKLAESYVEKGKGEINIIEQIYRAVEWPFYEDIQKLMMKPSEQAAKTFVKNNAQFPAYYYEDIRSRSIGERRRMAEDVRHKDAKILRIIWTLKEVAEKLAAANSNQTKRLTTARNLYQTALAVLGAYDKEVGSFPYEEARGGDRYAYGSAQVKYSLPMMEALAARHRDLIRDLIKLELKTSKSTSQDLIKLLFQHVEDRHVLSRIFFELSTEAVENAADEVAARAWLADLTPDFETSAKVKVEFLQKHIDRYDDFHLRLFLESLLNSERSLTPSFYGFSAMVSNLPEPVRKRVEKILLDLMAASSTVPELPDFEPFKAFSNEIHPVIAERKQGIYAGLAGAVEEIKVRLFDLLKEQEEVVINRVVKLLSADQLIEVLLSDQASPIAQRVAARALGEISDDVFLISKLREHPHLASWLSESFRAAVPHQLYAVRDRKGSRYFSRSYVFAERTQAIRRWLAYGLNDSEALVQNAVLPALLDAVEIPAFYHFFQKKIQQDRDGKLRIFIKTRIQEKRKKEFDLELYLLQRLVDELPPIESDALLVIETPFYYNRLLYASLEIQLSAEFRNRIRQILAQIKDNRKIPDKPLKDSAGTWPDSFGQVRFNEWEETTRGLATKFLDRWSEIKSIVEKRAAKYLYNVGFAGTDLRDFNDISTIYFFLSETYFFDDSLQISIDGTRRPFQEALKVLKPIVDANPNSKAQVGIHVQQGVNDTSYFVILLRSELRAGLGDLIKVRSQSAINRMRELFAKDVEPLLKKYASGRGNYPTGTPNPQMAGILRELAILVDQGKPRPSFTQVIEKIENGTLNPAAGTTDQNLIAETLKQFAQYISTLHSELRREHQSSLDSTFGSRFSTADRRRLISGKPTRTASFTNVKSVSTADKRSLTSAISSLSGMTTSEIARNSARKSSTSVATSRAVNSGVSIGAKSPFIKVSRGKSKLPEKATPVNINLDKNNIIDNTILHIAVTDLNETLLPEGTTTNQVEATIAKEVKRIPNLTKQNTFKAGVEVSKRPFELILKKTEGTDNAFDFYLVAKNVEATQRVARTLSPEQTAAFGELVVTSLVAPEAKVNLQTAVTNGIKNVYTHGADLAAVLALYQIHLSSNSTESVAPILLHDFTFTAGSPLLALAIAKDRKVVAVIATNGAEEAALEPVISELKNGEEIIVVNSIEKARSELRKRGFKEQELLASEYDFIPDSVRAWAFRVTVFNKAQMSRLLAAIEEASNQIRSELRIAQAA